MKLLVISDTHRRTENAINLIKKLKPDYVLHLGDVCEDCEKLKDIFPNQKILAVIGNNDYSSAYPSYPAERIFTLNNKKIFMCHGHTYNVKFGTDRLEYRAMQLNADIVLYGHTHFKHLDISPEMIVMNPGAVRSYGIIELNGDCVHAEVKDYE